MCGLRSKFCSYYAVCEPNKTQSLHYALFSQHLLATALKPSPLLLTSYSFAVFHNLIKAPSAAQVLSYLFARLR
ncbi:hypothetical protein STEG23_022671, partial [Scotinomys teguina]